MPSESETILKLISGIDESKIEEVLESFKKSEAKREEEKEREKTWKLVLKYFVHGIAFSLLFTVLYIAWIAGFIVLILLGSFIGLIIGLGLLVLVVGFINYILTSWMWFPLKSGFWDIMFHGVVLFVILLIVNGILIIPSFIFPGTVTIVITRVFGTFICGYLSKKVASWWRAEREGVPEALEVEWSDRKL